VLILGGGTLFAAAEVLKYQSVRRVLLVDQDPRVTEVAGRHYAHAKQCLHDSRFQLVTRDAYAGLPSLGKQFDLVINDGADLLDIERPSGKKNASIDIFSSMQAVLKPKGVCSDVIQRHLFERQRILRTLRRLQHRSRVALSLVLLPEYHGVLHVLALWGNDSSAVSQSASRPVNREQRGWIRRPGSCPCVYYDPRFLGYFLYLPRYLKDALAIKKRAA